MWSSQSVVWLHQNHLIFIFVIMFSAFAKYQYWRINFFISLSIIWMRIVFNEIMTLLSMKIHVCLRVVLNFVWQQNQFSFMQNVFRYLYKKKNHVLFDICENLFEKNLKWINIMMIVKKLQTFYNNSKHCRQFILYFYDKKRDVLSFANLFIEQNKTSNNKKNH